MNQATGGADELNLTELPMPAGTPDPSSEAELLTQFAELALAAGRADLAGEYLRRAACAAQPGNSENPEQLHATAIQFLNQQRFAEAEQTILRAIRLRPRESVWHDHLGVILARQNRLPEAEATFRLAARLDPANTGVVRNVIQACLDQRKYPEAEAAVRAALDREPRNDEFRVQLVTILLEQRKSDDARALLDNLFAAKRFQPAFWDKLGVSFGSAGLFPEAERCLREATRHPAASATSYGNLAAALGKMNRWSEAEVAARQATRLDPKLAMGWGNLGNALRDLGRLDEAERVIREAIRLDPKAPDPLGNLGLALAMNGRVREGLEWYDRSLALRPDAGEVRFNRAIALLSLGEYEKGWAEYEWRWRTDQMKTHQRKYPAPHWDGKQPLAKKTILVHSEQGIGDTFQFIRLTSELAAQGAFVVFASPPEIADLVKTCPGVGQVCALNEAPARLDFHAALMSLPYILKLRAESIPNRAPYLTPPQEAVARWRNRLAGIPGRKVGIVWQGNPKHIGDRWRSIPLTRFAPLASIPGVTIVSLQKGSGPSNSLRPVSRFSTWPPRSARTSATRPDWSRISTWFWQSTRPSFISPAR
ncbi:tetratricopeptide repeat protein [Fimbriiglobus ruber]|uniref:TPR repeat protein n=1 Tax=Fimbriiglobus ruber TaxID=1908690 RepID=A0A225E639_9BACT|nr:tetratricopeptide repeat protein [Fimbriiglobus ruber]OWK47234.1 TPR repeat protein [Fimbriiglobus ruber]